MRRLLPILPVLCILVASAPLLAQEGGRLETVREEVAGAKKENKEAPAKKERGHGHTYDDDDENEFLGQIVCWMVVTPWVVPHLALGDNLDDDCFFRPFPYANHGRGSMWIDHWGEPERNEGIAKPAADDLKRWCAAVTVDESNDLRGLNRLHGQILFDTCGRFGILSNWWWLHESLNGGGCDNLALGNVNLVYRFAESEWVQMRSGAGVQMVLDHDSRYGFNVTYGADVYPRRPVTASFVLDAGTAGDAVVLHGRATVGATWHGWEAFAGYDWLRIGTVDLSGPVLGVRWTF